MKPLSSEQRIDSAVLVAARCPECRAPLVPVGSRFDEDTEPTPTAKKLKRRKKPKPGIYFSCPVGHGKVVALKQRIRDGLPRMSFLDREPILDDVVKAVRAAAKLPRRPRPAPVVYPDLLAEAADYPT